jgi:hypothetical protein
MNAALPLQISLVQSTIIFIAAAKLQLCQVQRTGNIDR